MGFTRDTRSLTGFISEGTPVNNPAFATWDKDTLAAGTKFALGDGWYLNVPKGGADFKIQFGSTDMFKVEQNGDVTFIGDVTYAANTQISGTLDGGTF